MEERRDREGGEMRYIRAGEGAPLGRRRRRTIGREGICMLSTDVSAAAAAAVAVAGGGRGEQGTGQSAQRAVVVGVECELASTLKNVSRTEPAQAHSEIQACTLCCHEPEPGSTEQTHVTMNLGSKKKKTCPEIDFAHFLLFIQLATCS